MWVGELEMMTRARRSIRRGSTAILVITACVIGFQQVSGQERYARGQNVALAFEGWEMNLDGSYNMVFGYLNRNYEEILNIPIGPLNNIEPGGPDQGQPTRFYPRRHKYVFRIRVPKDFGKKELVWTLTAHGKTEKAFATLIPEYLIDEETIEGGNIGQRERKNKAPVVDVEGHALTAAVGQPLTLVARVTDDGLPKVAPPGGRESRPIGGLRIGWFVYRGDGRVTFDPSQPQPFERTAAALVPADGMSRVNATFSQPGTYVLRATADDGGLSASEDVTITVR
jgi:hypothetical protein